MKETNKNLIQLLEKFSETNKEVHLALFIKTFIQFSETVDINSAIERYCNKELSKYQNLQTNLNTINQKLDKNKNKIKELKSKSEDLDKKKAFLSKLENELNELNTLKEKGDSDIEHRKNQVKKLELTIKSNENIINKLDEKLNKLTAHYNKHFAVQSSIFGHIGEETKLNEHIKNLKKDIDEKLSAFDHIINQNLPDYTMYHWEEQTPKK